MKTAEQIKQWMLREGILEAFLCNIHKYENSTRSIDDIIGASVQCQLISGSFAWGLTDEGTDYWAAVDEKYKKWYDSPLALSDIVPGWYIKLRNGKSLRAAGLYDNIVFIDGRGIRMPMHQSYNENFTHKCVNMYDIIEICDENQQVMWRYEESELELTFEDIAHVFNIPADAIRIIK